MPEVAQTLERAEALVAAAGSLADLDAVRVRFLGKKGEITVMLKSLGKLPADQRPAAGLEINQAKTSVVNVGDQSQYLDFLGYSFRYDRSLYGRGPRYLNRIPSKKSLAKARETIRAYTATCLGGLPIGMVVRRLNRFLIGWSNYFRTGYPRQAFRVINQFVQEQLIWHLKRRSQRSLKPPKGMSWYTFIYDRLGVVQL